MPTPRLLSIEPSRETCAEAGWFAYDFLLDAPIDRSFILSMKPLGSLLFLESLPQAFFKIESDYYHIKGLLHQQHFRVAVHREHESELQRIRASIGSS